MLGSHKSPPDNHILRPGKQAYMKELLLVGLKKTQKNSVGILTAMSDPFRLVLQHECVLSRDSLEWYRG
jgi:hypothetical protein